MENKAQIVYFSHGGGPLPILGEPNHRAMVDFMKNLPSRLNRPEAILVISAHWEEQHPTVLGASHPSMFYDYYGFPEKAYQIQYPAPGDPELAKQIVEMLGKNHIQAKIDLNRGFDHGLFIPLELMYPEANIPSIQLSLIRGLDSAAHVSLGKALRDLVSENILIIGSGFSFHNQLAFFDSQSEYADPENDAFQNWLIETCTGNFSQEEREQRLIEWEEAPYARYCHPREEHLLPLMVCQGLANKPAKLIFDDAILRKRCIAFEW